LLKNIGCQAEDGLASIGSGHDSGMKAAATPVRYFA
jgi:hypothetical protein